MHVGQAEIAPAVPERQLRVIQSEQVQDRRVEIVDVAFVLGHLHSVIVRLAVYHPALHSASGQPRRESVGEMAAPVIAFRRGRAAKLGRPHDQRLDEQSARFQIADQPRDGLVNIARQRLVRLHIAVRVPILRRAHVNQFDETHAVFDHSPRDQSLPAEASGLPALQPVKLQRRVGTDPGFRFR